MLEVLAGDRGDRVLDVLLPLEGGADLGHVVEPSVAILLTARLIVKYSLSAGSTRMPISARKPTMMAQNSSPNSVTPR